MLNPFFQYVLLFGALAALDCSHRIPSEKVVPRPADRELRGDFEEAYRTARSGWTLVIDPQRRSGGPSIFSTVISGGKGEMGGFDFPLTVTATLMDDQVVEAGLRYYENMVGMDPAAAEDFRKTYWMQNELNKYLLIETLVQTAWAESYLDMSRWIIFIEDDRGNQYEPEKIFERPGSTQERGRESQMPGQKQQIPFDWRSHQKVVRLYFPRQDYQGNLTLYDGIEKLKIVFLLKEEPSSRGEGCWVFPVENGE
jgi:hypothetical protein